jgi:hypothetical protein
LPELVRLSCRELPLREELQDATASFIHESEAAKCACTFRAERMLYGDGAFPIPGNPAPPFSRASRIT